MTANNETVEELPRITKVETTALVGEDRDPAVVIWFANQSALRYRWNGEQIIEETYLDGVVHDSLAVGGSRERLAEYALESISEYIQNYQDNPEACKMDWGPIYEMLVADHDEQRT